MDKTIEQIKRAHQGDKTAREALVKDNLGLVWSIVRRFAGRGCETEDLFQIGSIGLLKAIDKFDLSYEVRFSTYAVPMIAGEIKRFLRDDGIIKVSRSIKEQNQRLRAAREALCTALGREPTLEELAAQIGVSCEEAAASMAADSPVESLSAPASAGEETGLLLQDRILNTGKPKHTTNGDNDQRQKQKLLLYQCSNHYIADHQNQPHSPFCFLFLVLDTLNIGKSKQK